MIIPSQLPSVGRSDAAAIAVTQRHSASAERQRAESDVFQENWGETSWPRGLVRSQLFGSFDGDSMMLYEKLMDEERYKGPKWLEVRNYPGIVSNGFRLYRSLGGFREVRE